MVVEPFCHEVFYIGSADNMSKCADVLDVEIDSHFTVGDAIIRDATRDFSMDEIVNRYSRWGVIMADVNRALDSIGWFDED
jgi:hypothetical protein